MTKKYRTPPFLTPAAIVSLIVAISAGNIAVNVATGTREGGQVAPKQTSVVSTVDNSSSTPMSESSSTALQSSALSSSEVLPSSSERSSTSETRATSSSTASTSSAKTPAPAVTSSVPETIPSGGAQ